MFAKLCRYLVLALLCAVAHAEQYGPVSAHESLWQIANLAQPGDEVTVQQTMLAILKKNPQAFTENNVNGLKKGARLQLPTRSEVADVPAWRAVSLIREQNHLWHQLAQKLEPTQPLLAQQSPQPTQPLLTRQQQPEPAQPLLTQRSESTETLITQRQRNASAEPAERSQVTMIYLEEHPVTEAEVAQAAPPLPAKPAVETVDVITAGETTQPAQPADQLLAVQENIQRLAHIEALESENQTKLEAMQRKMNDLIAYARSLQSTAHKAIKTNQGHLQVYFRSRWHGLGQEPHIPMAFVSATLAILLLYSVSQMHEGRQRQRVQRIAEVIPPKYTEDEDDEDLKDEYDFMGSNEGIPAKLDLARAYIDMQDHVAAKQVLQEILSQGDSAQQAAAQALLKTLK